MKCLVKGFGPYFRLSIDEHGRLGKQCAGPTRTLSLSCLATGDCSASA